jgi:DNA-binding response OmpR family regulator
MRVLIVEDEQRLADATARVLRREGIVVDIVYDGMSGLARASTRDYDVILLDRNLPELGGDELCAALVRRGTQAKILMVTAAGEVEARVAGLELGADDYLPKPVSLPELVARIRTLARRRGEAQTDVLSWRDLMLDRRTRVVTHSGVRIMVSRREYFVLEALLAANGGVVETRALVEAAWDDSAEYPTANGVRVAVKRLRRKLGAPDVIETVVGSGYRLR